MGVDEGGLKAVLFMQIYFFSNSPWLQVYEEAYHALHKELPEVSTSVFTEILTWIGQKVSAAGETSHT